MTKEELKPIDVSKYTVTESGYVIKDNLKQEAEEYANNLAFVFETDIVQRIVRERVRLALIDVLEPREKQIAELEKENAELRAKESFVGDQNRKLCEQQQKIEVLEAENAELKKQLGMSNKVYNDNLDYSHHIEGQLTKAKELIRSLYFVIQDRIDCKGNIPLEDEMYRAKQFLK